MLGHLVHRGLQGNQVIQVPPVVQRVRKGSWVKQERGGSLAKMVIPVNQVFRVSRGILDYLEYQEETASWGRRVTVVTLALLELLSVTLVQIELDRKAIVDSQDSLGRRVKVDCLVCKVLLVSPVLLAWFCLATVVRLATPESAGRRETRARLEFLVPALLGSMGDLEILALLARRAFQGLQAPLQMSCACPVLLAYLGRWGSEDFLERQDRKV